CPETAGVAGDLGLTQRGAAGGSFRGSDTFCYMEAAGTAGTGYLSFLSRRSGALALVQSAWDGAGHLLACSIQEEAWLTRLYQESCAKRPQSSLFASPWSPARQQALDSLAQQINVCSRAEPLAAGGARVRRAPVGKRAGLALEERGRRRTRRGWTMPGTLWCGAGDSAGSLTELGIFQGPDLCCREHDQCAEQLSALEYNYGMRNYRLHTISHCDCDARFRQCLLEQNDTISNIVGITFFNLLEVPCFVLEQSEAFDPQPNPLSPAPARSCGCYRRLDQCEHKIAPHELKYQCCNPDSRTLFHCNCTLRLARFLRRMKGPNEVEEEVLSDFISTACFVLEPPRGCADGEQQPKLSIESPPGSAQARLRGSVPGLGLRRRVAWSPLQAGLLGWGEVPSAGSWVLPLFEDPLGGVGRGQPRLGLKCSFFPTGWQHRITLHIGKAGGIGAWISCLMRGQVGGTAALRGPSHLEQEAGARREELLALLSPLPSHLQLPAPQLPWQHSAINSGVPWWELAEGTACVGAHGAGWAKRGPGGSAQAQRAVGGWKRGAQVSS
uniref:Phospholipase A2 group III n=1 Tax=Gopherus evgoodei TaxID=1825980 RepID=A0A8C4Y8R1_9SAUR